MTTNLLTAASKTGGEPKYVRIAQELRARIGRGVWTTGVMLPSRRRLAAEYGVSLVTLEQAISQLLADGTLYADGGRGTFVAAESADSPILVLEKLEHSDQSDESGRPVRNRVIGAVARGYSFSPQDHKAAAWPPLVVHAMERFLAQRPGFTVIEAAPNAESDPLAVMELEVRHLLATGVDALVFVFVDDHFGANRLMEIAGPEIPCLFVGSVDLGPFVPHIAYDSAYAGYQACRHLLEAGCREILFLSPFDEEWVQARWTGARRAAASMGDGAKVTAFIEPVDPMVIVGTQADLAHGQAAGLAGSLAGRGIIAVNDDVANGIVRAAAEAGLTAGRDYLIIGFDDIPASRVTGLTTMHPPLDAMGVEAGRLAIDLLRDRHDRTQVRLRSYLIPRASTQGTFNSGSL